MKSKSANTSFDHFISLGLQGRCKDSLAIARKIPIEQLSPKKSRIVKEHIRRFSAKNLVPKKSQTPILKLISIYEEYWHQSLLNYESNKQFERKLFQNIISWMKDICGVKLKTSSKEKIVDRLKKEIEHLGFFCITGTVAHLQELEIWQTQKKVTYSVRLPETTEKVTTILMSDFLTKGWVAYATMGFHYPGGWAKKEGIYCNTHAYNLKSEKFSVSYLGHEAQHYSDYKSFPRLGQIDLEYRAKLAEFALAKKITKKMFQAFATRAEYNKKSPHAFSYFCVLRDLAYALNKNDDFNLLANKPSMLKTIKINTAAKTLLKKNTEALRAKGAKKVIRFIT